MRLSGPVSLNLENNIKMATLILIAITRHIMSWSNLKNLSTIIFQYISTIPFKNKYKMYLAFCNSYLNKKESWRCQLLWCFNPCNCVLAFNPLSPFLKKRNVAFKCTFYDKFLYILFEYKKSRELLYFRQLINV